MDLSNITIVGGPLVLASVAEVGKAQDQLWITFPRGYQEFVTTLGEGVLGGSFVRVYPPWRIVNELAEWRGPDSQILVLGEGGESPPERAGARVGDRRRHRQRR